MSKFCPNCGEELIDSAKFCKNCGKDLSNFQKGPDQTFNDHTQFISPVVEKSHTAATVLGYVFAFLIPIIGVIFGIYLLTRDDNAQSKTHGKIVIVLSLVIWFISYFFF